MFREKQNANDYGIRILWRDGQIFRKDIAARFIFTRPNTLLKGQARNYQCVHDIVGTLTNIKGQTVFFLNYLFSICRGIEIRMAFRCIFLLDFVIGPEYK